MYLPDNQPSTSHSASRQDSCFIKREMHYLSSEIFSSMHLNWFDAVVVVWLIVGIVLGRKHGMSQELLPLVQWIAVVVCGGFLYLLIARPLAQRTGLTLLP